MKIHPQQEEWVDYLCQEITPGKRQELDQHLNSCSKCREQLAKWKTTSARLDSWQMPKARQRSTALRWVNLAAAACILLSIGFALGRQGNAKNDQLRAQIKIEMAGLLDQQKKQVYNDFVLALERSRQEDRFMVETLVSALTEDQNQKLVRLRQDLETVATSTDAQIQDARFGLAQLTSYAKQTE